MALLRAIGASRRQVLASVIGESIVVGAHRERDRRRRRASACRSACKALLNAVGFDIPGKRRRRARRTRSSSGSLVGHDRHDRCRRSCPARQAARVPPIAAMRDVALERPINRARAGSASAACIAALGVVLLFVGLFGGSRHLARRARRAAACFVGVFVLGPLFARPRRARASVRRSRSSRASPARLARENAARNPKRTVDDRRGGDDRRSSLVGFITIFAASANASIGTAIDQQTQDRLHHQRAAAGFGGRGFSPELAQTDRASSRRSQAVTPVRARRGRDRRQSRRCSPRPTRGRATSCSTSRRRRARSPTSATDGIAVSKRKADEQPLEDRHRAPGDVRRQTGKTTLQVAFIYKKRIVRATTSSRCRTYEKNFARPARHPDLRQAQAGRHRRRKGRDAIEPLLDAVPDRQAEGQRAVQGRPEEAGQPGRSTSSTCCCSSR